MAHLVLTVIGDDREGLVSALSRSIDSHGGNWLDSQFARLSGTFAGIVLVDMPAASAQAFSRAAADLLDEVGLSVQIRPAPAGTAHAGTSPSGDPAAAPADAEGQEVRVHLVGLDRPGTVRQVSTAIAEQGVSIVSFRSWTSDAPQGGGVLFEAEALVLVPAGRDTETVRAALEPIAAELMVDLDLEDQHRP